MTCEVASDTGTHALNTNVVWFIGARKTCAKFEIDAAIVYVRRYMFGGRWWAVSRTEQKKRFAHECIDFIYKWYDRYLWAMRFHLQWICHKNSSQPKLTGEETRELSSAALSNSSVAATAAIVPLHFDANHKRKYAFASTSCPQLISSENSLFIYFSIRFVFEMPRSIFSFHIFYSVNATDDNRMTWCKQHNGHE